MIKKNQIISTLLISTCLITLVSCGSDSSGGGSKNTTRSEEQQLGDEGIYRAVLSPLNTTLSGNTNGTVEIKIEADNVSVKSNVADAPQGVKHLQNIMVGGKCPTAAADANSDTLVDISEAMKVTGQILIPLDSDLSTQLDGISFGPISNGAGSYVYKRSTTLTNLLSDLNALDPDPSDAVTKIKAGDDLNLSGRVVLIHGVRSSSELPDSVVALGDHSAATALPIACGVLVRVRSEGSDSPVPEPAETESTESMF